MLVNKIGLVFFVFAAIVVIGRFTYPNVVTDQVLPIAIVLVVMGGIAGFPEQFMKMMNPGLVNAPNNLQTHLTQMGVQSELIDSKSPEAIKHKPPTFSNDPIYVPPIGVAKISGRNIDLIEWRARIIPQGASRARSDGWRAQGDAMGVQYVCAIKGNIKEENTCKASSENGYWSGGKLADTLNQDTDLKAMMNKIPNARITVRGIKSDSYVAIYKEGLGKLQINSPVPTFGIENSPTADEFNAFDKIAGHVKQVLS
jgi:hypothetical protein